MLKKLRLLLKNLSAGGEIVLEGGGGRGKNRNNCNTELVIWIIIIIFAAKRNAYE